MYYLFAPDLGIRLQGSGTFKWFDALEYQGTISKFCTTVHFFNTMQISSFPLIDTLNFLPEAHCLDSEASALQTNCWPVVISKQVEEQLSQEQRPWIEHCFSGKGILAEWRCANCKAITLLLGAASSANCKAIRSTRAPAIREGGLQWSPLSELAGFPQLYPLRSLFPSGNSLRPSQFCRWEVF